MIAVRKRVNGRWLRCPVLFIHPSGWLRYQVPGTTLEAIASPVNWREVYDGKK
jgi:hypothetical protein